MGKPVWCICEGHKHATIYTAEEIAPCMMTGCYCCRTTKPPVRKVKFLEVWEKNFFKEKIGKPGHVFEAVVALAKTLDRFLPAIEVQDEEWK